MKTNYKKPWNVSLQNLQRKLIKNVYYYKVKAREDANLNYCSINGKGVNINVAKSGEQ